MTKKTRARRKTRVEALLDKVRKNPSPRCQDPRQTDLMDYLKRKAFVKLDEAIDTALSEESKGDR